MIVMFKNTLKWQFTQERFSIFLLGLILSCSLILGWGCSKVLASSPIFLKNMKLLLLPILIIVVAVIFRSLLKFYRRKLGGELLVILSTIMAQELINY
jgi:hypothetical protein